MPARSQSPASPPAAGRSLPPPTPSLIPLPAGRRSRRWRPRMTPPHYPLHRTPPRHAPNLYHPGGGYRSSSESPPHRPSLVHGLGRRILPPALGHVLWLEALRYRKRERRESIAGEKRELSARGFTVSRKREERASQERRESCRLEALRYHEREKREHRKKEERAVGSRLYGPIRPCSGPSAGPMGMSSAAGLRRIGPAPRCLSP